MVFHGITKSFSTLGDDQYNTIGAFWDEMSEKYGLENLRGLGYSWHDNMIEYAICFKDGIIPGANFALELPNDGWQRFVGMTDNLERIYDEIYKLGPLTYEIESFNNSGECEILYFRK